MTYEPGPKFNPDGFSKTDRLEEIEKDIEEIPVDFEERAPHATRGEAPPLEELEEHPDIFAEVDQQKKAA